MTSTAPPICVGCTRRIGDLLDPKCEAYPESIPTPILLSQVDHRDPYHGDHGLQFKPKTEADAKRAAILFDKET